MNTELSINVLILKKHEKAQIKAKIKRKNPENQRFSGFLGGDKRDRTADLLNAIGFYEVTQWKKIHKSYILDA